MKLVFSFLLASNLFAQEFSPEVLQVAQNHGVNREELVKLPTWAKTILYTMTGVTAEILFTAAQTIPRNPNVSAGAQWNLEGYTQAWVFPLYIGGQSFVEKVMPKLRTMEIRNKKVFENPLMRGLVYMLLFYSLEYAGGKVAMTLTGEACPWHYEGPYAFANGILNLPHAPVWMIAGLVAEPWVDFVSNLYVPQNKLFRLTHIPENFTKNLGNIIQKLNPWKRQ